jgi:hypothetical protein
MKENGPPVNGKKETDGKKLKRTGCVYTIQISIH